MLDGLVRPYVLGTGDHAARHSPAAEPAPPRAPDEPAENVWPDDPAVVEAPDPATMESQDSNLNYWLTGDWASDPAPRWQPEDESGLPGEPSSPGSPGPLTKPMPAIWPDGHRRAAGRRRSVAVSLGAGALAIIVTAGVISILAQHHSRGSANGCGARHCASLAPRPSLASLPPTATPSVSVRTHHTPTPATTPTASASAPARASTSAAPTPSRTPPAPTPSPSPTVTKQAVSVGYSVVQQWSGGFQGEFTISNHGSTAINGWELAAALPGDWIYTVWDASYRISGDVVIMDPPSYQQTIAPGASLTENFTAGGNTTSPASCTFNGAPC